MYIKVMIKYIKTDLSSISHKKGCSVKSPDLRKNSFWICGPGFAACYFVYNLWGNESRWREI